MSLNIKNFSATDISIVTEFLAERFESADRKLALRPALYWKPEEGGAKFGIIKIGIILYHYQFFIGVTSSLVLVQKNVTMLVIV